MLTVKEQSEVYRLGLLIGYFKINEVIHWADSIILIEDYPDVGVVDVSLAGGKGVNEVISQLDNVKGKMNVSIPAKTLLGLLLRKLINHEDTVFEIARKLYVLSQNISTNSLSEDLLRELIVMEDIFYIYGEESVKLKVIDLLKDFEVYADDFNSCFQSGV